MYIHQMQITSVYFKVLAFICIVSNSSTGHLISILCLTVAWLQYSGRCIIVSKHMFTQALHWHIHSDLTVG